MMKAEEALALANQYTDTHGGGGGGTKDYEALDNKPSINDVELSGNKTSSDLGLMDHYDIDERPTEDSENLIPSGAVWEANMDIKDKLQGSKQASSTSGTIEIPDYGMTESIDMYFKPTQDLHGYDKPWAGGAGKNIGQLSTSNIQSVNGHQNDVETYANNGVIVTSTGNYGRCGYQYSVQSGKTYTISMMVKKSASVGGGGILLGNTTNWAAEYGDFRDNAITTSFTKITKTFTAADDILYVGVYPVVNGVSITIEDFMIEEGEQATTFEPYSNICPISGQDNAKFEWTDSHDIENEASMNFGNTYYGGFCQFATGAIYSEWDYIASYNGETLPSEWMSDRDEYRAGTTPTIGAEVVYKTTPTMAVVRKGDMNLTDDYPIQFNGWLASVTYQPKNTVLLQAKEYTNQKLLSAGLPTPPTTDGTYHLECSVSGGIPTITWVANT